MRYSTGIGYTRSSVQAGAVARIGEPVTADTTAGEARSGIPGAVAQRVAGSGLLNERSAPQMADALYRRVFLAVGWPVSVHVRRRLLAAGGGRYEVLSIPAASRL